MINKHASDQHFFSGVSDATLEQCSLGPRAEDALIRPAQYR
jgi:hypothetical protein